MHMPFAGNNFVRNQNFVSDRNAGPPSNTISAEKVDNEFDNLTAGLTIVKTAHETQKSLFPVPATANAGQYMRTNAAGTAFELRTAEQTRTDLSVVLPGRLAFQYPTTTQWVVPAGVRRVWVEVYGGGGGTTGFYQGTANAKMYSGGGGGYAASYIDVTPGAVIPITVGAAGATGSTGPGTNGGDSSFGTFLSAGGGKSVQYDGDVAMGGTAPYSATIFQMGGRGRPAPMGGVEAKSGMAGGPLGGRAIGWFDAVSPWPGAGGSAQQLNQTNAYYTAAGAGAVIVSW